MEKKQKHGELPPHRSIDYSKRGKVMILVGIFLIVFVNYILPEISNNYYIAMSLMCSGSVLTFVIGPLFMLLGY